ncbi:MAG: hypothetical protein QXI91_07500 [Candidatus Bathyarchaeia archaeon]
MKFKLTKRRAVVLTLIFIAVFSALLMVMFSLKRDLEEWDKIEIEGGSVTVKNGKFEFNFPMEDSCAGVVSKESCNLNQSRITVYLSCAGRGGLCLLISNNKDTTENPLRSQPSDTYAIHMAGPFEKIFVYRSIGKNWRTVKEKTWAAESNTFMIEIVNGTIKFYEGETCIYEENYQLPSYNCYIYIFSFNMDGAGVDWAENFNMNKIE